MKSYSHPATRQDMWVLDKISTPGMFVELGAYDGITHSNTYLLEKLGWYGFLIEGHTPYYQECCRNRPKASLINAVVGDGKEHQLIVGGQYTGLYISMPEAWRQEHIRRNNPTICVKTSPLSKLIGIERVDYLSLDTEGNEYEILSDWLQAGGSANVLTVEFRYDAGLLMRLEQLLDEHDMHLDELRGFDACFIRNNLRG